MSNQPTTPAAAPAAHQAGVQRQIVLPLSKAVEIAYKSIRQRLSRSLLVTSGIVLALAFLMSILASDAMIGAMRQWAAGQTASVELETRRDALAEGLRALDTDLRKSLTEAAAATAPAGAVEFDAHAVLGKTMEELTAELGVLPVAGADMTKALTNKPELLAGVQKWIAMTREIRAIKDELTAPKRLVSLMQANGVPTDPAEIAGSKTQTYWLLALALLVAFVGILNAMLMSVTERFREIGTMKCLGALDSFIIKLFLLESMFQGFVGTVIGVTLGLVLSVTAAWISYSEFAWKVVPYGQIGASIGLCLLIGVGLTVAGAVYPAWQAARMQPIEAMRVET
jgi:hypothetical protein